MVQVVCSYETYLLNYTASLPRITQSQYYSTPCEPHIPFRSSSSVRTRNRVHRLHVTKVDLQLLMFRFKPYSRVVAYISLVLMDRRFRYSGQISSYGMRQICSYFVSTLIMSYVPYKGDIVKCNKLTVYAKLYSIYRQGQLYYTI